MRQGPAVKPLALAVAAAGLLLAGCGSEGPPEVTFHASGKTIVVTPTQHCDKQVKDCKADPKAAGVLKVPADQPVQISVPSTIGSTPWQVVFRYRKSDGGQIEGRSPVFKPESQLAYTLKLPEPGSQLETIEVQQFGAGMAQRPDGGVDFFTRGTWVVSIDDRT